MFVTRKKFSLAVTALTLTMLQVLDRLEELETEDITSLRDDVDYLLESLEDYLD